MFRLKNILPTFFILFNHFLFAQNKQHPHYWKTNPPTKAYWQQDVEYEIDAEIDPKFDLIKGSLSLTYTNNSPDTLTEIYFHLYQNAFQPESYRDQLLEGNKIKAKYGENEENFLGTVIPFILQGKDSLEFSIDNTILKASLSSALLPGSTTVISMPFRTWFDLEGNQRRRMKGFFVPVKRPDGSVYKVKHYDGVHWYPRVAVYDQKMRWHLDQHLGKEFYGEFGSYDVSLTFPDNYILDATGSLTNPDEVMPLNLREAVDIERYAEKKWNTIADELIPPSNKKKKWVFHADFVHDFAFTADPTYRIGIAEWNGIKCVALAQEAHASGWQDAAEFTAKTIQCYSEWIGMYGYPKMIVADARDGMEYPMLTLDGGRSPSYYGLLVHEVGHNWFFGMIGTNETYRAGMDEGFTQFLTAHAMEQLTDGIAAQYGRKGKIKISDKYTRNLYGYIKYARKGYDGSLNTHSHDYNGSIRHENGYGMVYYKMATMLQQLRLVLGEEKFWGAMQHYFNQWKFAHPYPEDFRNSITDYTKTDLSWFFDQWMETDERCDYAIGRIKRKKKGTKNDITFLKKGKMEMPVPFDIITVNNDTLKYTIPASEYRITKDDREQLATWISSDKVNEQHKIRIYTPSRIKKIIIDPEMELADIDRTNNSNKPIPVWFRPSLIPLPQTGYPLWDKYYLNLRPSIWWNGYSGLQIGAALHGDYFNDSWMFDLKAWYNTGWGQITTSQPSLEPFSNDYQRFSYDLKASTPLKQIGRNASINIASTWRDGLHRHQMDFTKKWAEGSWTNPNFIQISAGYKVMHRQTGAMQDYLIQSDQWTTGQTNAQFIFNFKKGYQIVKGNGLLEAELRNASLGSGSKFSYLEIMSRNEVKIHKLELKYRLIGRYGTGDTPLESMLYLAGGSPEEMFESDFYRARGFFPNPVLDNDLGRETWNMHYGGGLNLRGYSGYAAEFNDGMPAWYGNSGIALNLELDFDQYIPLRIPKLGNWLQMDGYVFMDAGVIARSLDGSNGFDQPDFSKFRMDVGIGTALHISDPWFFDEQPLTIRLDMPFFVNAPPFQENFFAPRWMLAIGRAF